MKNFIFFSLLNLPSVFMLLIKKREITLDWEPLSAAEGWPVNVRITQLIFAPVLLWSAAVKFWEKKPKTKQCTEPQRVNTGNRVVITWYPLENFELFPSLIPAQLAVGRFWNIIHTLLPSFSSNWRMSKLLVRYDHDHYCAMLRNCVMQTQIQSEDKMDSYHSVVNYEY